jgi:hypothetical protein
MQIGGGSLRIYRSDVQQKVFDAIGLSKQEAQSKFGYLLDAFEMGAPPHGGIAFGLDRLVRTLPLLAVSSICDEHMTSSCTAPPSSVAPCDILYSVTTREGRDPIFEVQIRDVVRSISPVAPPFHHPSM